MATKHQVIYGWLYNRVGHMLYVYQKPGTWGITEKPEEATPFPSVQACIDHYMSKHAFPKDYVNSTRNGYLKFLDKSTHQTILF